MLDELSGAKSGLTYSDNRDTGSLTDFTLKEEEVELPINIKNAGTRFERAEELVGLDPNDCLPIPAYKAHAAVDAFPNLLYVISVDYQLIHNLDTLLPKLMSDDETIVWALLNEYVGPRYKNAEDLFIFSIVNKYWDQLKGITNQSPFYVISARKAIKILNSKPKRTPGIGLKAWGTGASSEINVHVSIKEDTTPWDNIQDRIIRMGIQNIIEAVNRKRYMWVYDPEI